MEANSFKIWTAIFILANCIAEIY